MLLYKATLTFIAWQRCQK